MSNENCILCQIVGNQVPAYVIYEDDIALGILDVNGAQLGHTFIIPKNHYPILEQVPDEEIGHLFNVANKISSALFEKMKIQGTNIYVTNGIPAGQRVAHFMINVIPRLENDGINLQWAPKQLGEEEMSTVELKLKDQAQTAVVSKQAKRPSKVVEHAVVSDDDEDYYAGHLNRIP